jgi:hypothetical protein
VKLHGVDVTGHLISQVRAQVDASAAARNAYHASIDNWMARCTCAGFVKLKREDHASAVRLKNVTPVSAALHSLGNSFDGWKGNLNMFNFLYTEIPLQPLSLRSGLGSNWDRVQNATTVVLSFSAARPDLRSKSVPLGAIAYTAVFKYDNELADDVSLLSSQVSTGGAIHERLTQLRQAVSDLESEFSRSDGVVSDLISRINGSLDELRRL